MSIPPPPILPLPADEAARLATLRALDILDTPPEEGFDRLTRTACRLFGVPMAAISLLDADRQWFKSRQGLPMSETPRDLSFCAHTILEKESLCVTDATADPRFADSPLVTGELAIRFYAGHVLRAHDGRALGALCLMDTQPRDFTDADRLALGDLAAVASTEFERRRTDRALERQIASMQLIEMIAVASNEAHTVEEAVTFTLSRLCTFTGWPTGHFWGIDPVSGELAPSACRHLEDPARHLPLFEGPGAHVDQALVELVLASGSPATAPPRVVEGPLWEDRRRQGLVGAIAFPVFVGERIWGVLSFCLDRVQPLDGLLLDIMGHIGAQVGQVLERERTEAQRREVERLKGEFVSIVSHELRTPINTMMGALELLDTGKVGDLPPKAARMVRIAFDNNGRLMRLVNDMLDIQLLEWGRLPILLDGADVAELMRQAGDTMRDHAARLGLTFEVAPIEARVLADADRIVQTLTNLIGNAFKYTPAGGRVSLIAAVVGQEVRFEVHDSGRGVPEQEIERIFEKYQQFAPGDAREKGGAGLGLAIARGIVQRHGGRTWATSAPGAGSRFFFTLPLVAPVDATAP